MPTSATPRPDLQAAKTTAATGVARAQDDLVALSRAIHAAPELCFEEVRAAAGVSEAMERAGFAVTVGLADMPTAVLAEAGSGELVVTLCAEYDALPGIGHACGHNVIAAAAVGAALALAPLADDLGLTVRLLGTPAEEGGGGKVYLMDAGAFDGTHLAMMVHPAPMDLAGMNCLASKRLDIGYAGRSAHAAAYPELGINAADALTVAQVGIGLLRQHLYPGDRVHGIVTDGGDAPNIVPERTGGRWLVRGQDLAALARLEPRVRACFDAGALATGATVTVTTSGPAYSEFAHDDELEELWVANARGLDREMAQLGPEAASLAGSTDMANVSLGMPSLHPMIGIATNGAVNHQPAFTAACATPSADLAVHDGAVGLAQTAVDAALDEGLRARLLARAYAQASHDRPATVPPLAEAMAAPA